MKISAINSQEIQLHALFQANKLPIIFKHEKPLMLVRLLAQFPKELLSLV